MNDQNTDAAKKAAELNEERMHPIFDECEVNDFGVTKREHMLSMNGMYIAGITDAQLEEMHEKLTELLTGEKRVKYYYVRASIASKECGSSLIYDFVVEAIGMDKFPLMECLHYAEKAFEDEKDTLDLSKVHITTCFEISKKNYEEFRAYRQK